MTSDVIARSARCGGLRTAAATMILLSGVAILDATPRGSRTALPKLPSAAASMPAQPKPRQLVTLDAALELAPLPRGSRVRAAVEAQIARGFHINANPATYDYLIATTVKIAGVPGLTIDKVFYPEAEIRSFAFASDPLAVYEGSAVSGLEIVVDGQTATGAYELEIELGYQACNDTTCFAPAKATLRLPVTIAATDTTARPTGAALFQRAKFEEQPR